MRRAFAILRESLALDRAANAARRGRANGASSSVGCSVLLALDHESERVVQENLRAMARGRTVLIIAHRLAAVRDADRMLVVERGRVVEDGTHEALVRSGGRYAGLWAHQLGNGVPS